MKKSKEVTLGNAIQNMLKSYKMDDKVVALKIEENWPAMMGPAVARLTRTFRFKEGILTIHLESSVLRKELSMSKSLLIQNLNEFLGGEVVKDVILG